MAAPTIIEAMQDPHLFGPWFADRDSWGAWTVFLKALSALPMSSVELKLYRHCTGRIEAPRAPFGEAWLVVGRRGGKSFVVAVIAVFLASFRDWSAHLAPGERGTVMVIATDRKQARVIMRYVMALLEGAPMLARLVSRSDQESVDLTNRISVEVHSASYRAVRGYTVVAALLDEVAFFRSDDSANPDREILTAVRPAMATVEGALLIGLSTPYARRGVLWETYRDHFGRNGSRVLVWQADTRTMNPLVPEAFIAAEYERDPVAAAAEFGAVFRSDLEGFIEREAAEACVVPGRFELPPMQNVEYLGFVDPSGGSRDSMTLAIAHSEESHLVLDALRERRPPFSPDDVVREFARVLKAYRCQSVRGDRYGGEWPRERFREHGVEYQLADKARSELYQALLPELNSGCVELLDNQRLLAQLCGLERRTSRSGRDNIDHPRGGHDDLINAAAGALVASATGRPFPKPFELPQDFSRPSYWRTI